MLNQDFRDLFAEFNAQTVEFMVVGAHALAVHGHVRATRDLDVWVRPDRENARRVLAALQAFGAPTEGLSIEDLSAPGLTFQIGIEPVRIDILTSIDGIEFGAAWRNRVGANYGDQGVPVLSRNDLILNKRASGRTQDLADVEALQRETPSGTG